MNTINLKEYWAIHWFFIASWLTLGLYITLLIISQFYAWFGGDSLYGLMIAMGMMIVPISEYVSIGILGVSIYLGLRVHTLRTTILAVLGICFIATVYLWGVPYFTSLDLQAILVIAIISLSTIFKYQIRNRKG